MKNFSVKELEHIFANDFQSPIFPILAHKYFSIKQYNKAEKVCDIGLKHHQNDSAGLFILAQIERLEGNLKEAETALKVAKFLSNHRKIEKVNYLGLINKSDKHYSLYKKQYGSGGAMITVYIKGNLDKAYKFLDKIINILNLIAENYKLPIIISTHPRTKKRIELFDSSLVQS